jgi:hypothetical protein
VANPIQLGIQLLGLREAIGAFGSIASRIEEIDTHVGSIVEAIHSTGGSAGDVGALGAFARLGGQDPKRAGSAARGLREQIAGNPLAQAVFGQSALPAETGQLVNEAKLFRQVVTQILNARTDEEARMKAQIAAMEHLLPLRDAEPRLIEETIRAAERRGRMVDAQMRRERANFQAMRSLRQEAVEGLGIAIERRLLPAMRGAEEGIGAVAAALADLINDPGGNARKLAQGARDAVTDPATGSRGFHNRLGGVISRGTSVPSTPMDKNTLAMQDLTEELVALRREYLNDRGNRAGGAVPRYLRGKGLEKALENASFELGAVTF